MVIVGSCVYGLDRNCSVWKGREKGEGCCGGDEVELKKRVSAGETGGVWHVQLTVASSRKRGASSSRSSSPSG